MDTESKSLHNEKERIDTTKMLIMKARKKKTNTQSSITTQKEGRMLNVEEVQNGGTERNVRNSMRVYRVYKVLSFGECVSMVVSKRKKSAGLEISVQVVVASRSRKNSRQVVVGVGVDEFNISFKPFLNLLTRPIKLSLRCPFLAEFFKFVDLPRPKTSSPSPGVA